MSFFEAFHFLRPGWLLLIPVVLLLLWIYQRRYSMNWRWKAYIPEHLLSHLLVSSAESRRVTPVSLSLLMMLLGTFALSGPSWKTQPAPFSKDEAPLVIALKLSPSMMADDVQPSRLAIAKLKIKDLLAVRGKAPTALVVYADSAHAVLPLTDDPDVLDYYLDDLSPDVMPSEGDRPSEALSLALRLLSNEAHSGSWLLMTDSVPVTERDQLTETLRREKQHAMLLLLGTEEGLVSENFATDGNDYRVDKAGIVQWAASASIDRMELSIDQSDIEAIANSATQAFTAEQSLDQQNQPVDAGYWLLWPVALLTLLWFRRGMVLQWR